VKSAFTFQRILAKICLDDQEIKAAETPASKDARMFRCVLVSR
jgi:hypothetical protein